MNARGQSLDYVNKNCLINMKYIHELKILDHEASANLGTDWRDRHPYDLGVVG